VVALKKFKTLITDPDYFPAKNLEPLEQISEIISKKFSRAELLNAIREADAILIRVDTKLDQEILSKAKKLKVIGSATTSLDHIDVNYAAERGIQIVSLQGEHTVSTAEFTFTLILSLLRKLPWAFESLKQGNWNRSEFLGTELRGKTLGIIGFGKIGKEVARIAQAFGMSVIAYDPFVDAKEAESIGVKLFDLETVLKSSDIVTIHALLTQETKGMINAEKISKMKPTACLINVARGEIVDEDALVDALESKKIAAAACDVFSNEPLDKNSRLIKYTQRNNNLLITPHIGASTADAVEIASRAIIQKVKEILLKW
jgi:D-3-phosphoglycerate dehydrogenase